MLNGIRKVLDADRLAERVAELEADNKRLREEVSRRLINTSFSEVKRPFQLGDGLRDFVYEHAARDLEGVVEDHLLSVAKEACKAAKPLGGRHASFYGNVAIADYCDAQVEVVLPEVRTWFRVGGYFR